ETLENRLESYGQSRYHVYRGELDLALRLDKELLCVSRQRDDSGGLVLAHQAYGTGQMVCGRFALSRSHLEAVLALYDPALRHALGEAEANPRWSHRPIWGLPFSVSAFPTRH